jgi:hypothetical protein
MPGSVAKRRKALDRLAGGDAELVGRCRRSKCSDARRPPVRIDAQRDRAPSCRASGAIRDSASASGIDSRLKVPMPAASAARISSADLPTPAKTMRSGSAPIALQALQLAARDDVEAAPARAMRPSTASSSSS